VGTRPRDRNWAGEVTLLLPRFFKRNARFLFRIKNVG
jgi:hypothetical protein